MMRPEDLLEAFAREPDGFRRIPVAVYRLQLRGLTFREVARIIPYLAALGITDCYLSPFLEPASSDSHGYDIADHGRLDPALGTAADYHALCDALRAYGMGQIADVVPNHMGISGSRNGWWFDVLENGLASPCAPYFDIDWDPVKPELKGKILLPILGDQYGRVLENQELTLEFRDGAFVIRYYDTLLPVEPRSYTLILHERLDELETALGAEHPDLLELKSIITALTHLPEQTETDPERLVERSREKEIIKRRLATLARQSEAVRAFVDETVRIFNGVKGQPETFDRLDRLFAAQAYRPAFWQTAADEINYRRFFDINELAAIRVEHPAVFEATHRLILDFVREARVTGLRVDHPDGLYSPVQYFKALQRRCFVEVARRLAAREAGPETAGWVDAVGEAFDAQVAADPAAPLARPFYVVAEKVLMRGERLPGSWPVHGTTGYEFLNALNGIFVDPAGRRAIDAVYRRFSGARQRFRDLAYECKKLVMDTTMSSEIHVLGQRAARISEKQRFSRDFTDRSLTDALREIIACFPVYRTYIGEDGLAVTDGDRRFVEQAVADAKQRNPTMSPSIFDFIRLLLTLEFPGGRSDADRDEQLTFVMKFQQLTGPVMAKGLEDTAFYRFNRLVSLNEVGGDPDGFGVSVAEFHRLNAERQARWPWGFSATATHDSKRGEDVRARINTLSEVPRLWGVRLRTWHRLNRRKKRAVNGVPVPDQNEEYLLYQTLLGAWPAGPLSGGEYREFIGRVQRYVFKALREAKVHASWITPNPEYEAALTAFVGAILDRLGDNPFLADFLPFQRRVAAWGAYNSLSQTLLKVTAPGVPDFYQGTELWDLTLVDPDNRQPVDFRHRRERLDTLVRQVAEAGSDLSRLVRELMASVADGGLKLYVTLRALACRRQHPRLFLHGDYVPLAGRGRAQDHLVAFARRAADQAIVVAAPRLVVRLAEDRLPLGEEGWHDTWLALEADSPGARYRNVFTDALLEVVDRNGEPALPGADLFRDLPVALLERRR